MTNVKKGYISFFLICIFSIIFINTVKAQVFLQNPSFEDTPADATTPQGWIPCAPYTTPDIFPGYWGVYNESTEGETFVGIITREDGSYESISTRLSENLEAGKCYSFSIDLAHSKTYAGYNGSIKLKFYVGTEKCDDAQLIYETELIKHAEWKNYPIQFYPEKDVRYLLIEASYTKKRFSHKGNALLDNISPIINCNKA